MASERWECMEVHSNTYEQRNKLVLEVVELLEEMVEKSHLKTYFFNRYSDPAKSLYFIKLGLVDSDDETKSELDSLFNRLKSSVKPYNCEMWEVDGVPIDRIKCASREMFETVRSTFNKRISAKQAFYLLHFLMNQIGYSYRDEYELYKLLAENVEKKL